MRITATSLSRNLRLQPLALAALLLTPTVFLSGCGMGSLPGSSNSATSIVAAPLRISGTVFGGQQPITGATIQLYSVGTTGPDSASSALIATPLTTDGNGGFSIGNNAFSCTAATQVYLVATGGNSGSGNNSAISLMAALGPCLGITTATHISINELTTVAAVYALSPFMSDFAHVGATGSNPAGLVSAFTEAQMLVSSSTGQIATPSAGVTLPVSVINTVADVLAACVNTANAIPCPTLMTATGASETVGAGLAIAKNPGSPNIVSLWTLASSTPPFVPAASSRPNDLTLAIKYAGAELQAPFGIALDTNGNAWVTNEAGRSVTKLPTPAPVFTSTTFSSGGLLAPRGVSIDRTGNVWIANTGGNSVVKLDGSGNLLSGAGFTTGIATPVSVANDSAGNAFIANLQGNSVAELSSAGAAVGASPFTGAGVLSQPASVALDSTGSLAVANVGTGQVCLFSNAAVFKNCLTDGILFGANAVAVSSTGNIVAAGSTTGATVTGAFTLATSGGTSNVTGGGLTLPVAVAYDGSGTAWFANTASISAFSGSSALSPSTGLGTLNTPGGIAVDASGNVWTANTGDNSVSIFVGLATPVKTPIALNVGP